MYIKRVGVLCISAASAAGDGPEMSLDAQMRAKMN